MFNTLNILGVSVGLFNSVPIDITKYIADIREPGKRSVAFSKTITIPQTREVNILFEFAFDINIDFQIFNPNKKIAGSYFVGTTSVLRGYIQLLSIPLTSDSGNYEISIVSDNADLFQAMGDKLLTDLSFSDLDHALNSTNFFATPTLGNGYCYAYEDRGMAGVNGYNWNILHMKAMIFAREYLKRIFAQAGKTWTSVFLNSVNFSHVVIPCNKSGMYQFSPTQIYNNQFYANKTATQTYGTTFIPPVGFNNYNFTTGVVNSTLIFQDETTAPFNDPGGNYNNATGVFTLSQSSQNQFSCDIIYSINVSSAPATSVNFVPRGNGTQLRVAIFRNGVQVYFLTSMVNQTIPLISLSGSVTARTQIVYQAPTNDPPGTTYTAVLVYGFINGEFKDSGGLTVVGGTPSVNFVIENNSTFWNNLLNTNLTWGSTIDMNTVILDDVKQTDFFLWIMQTFHLFIEQDINDVNNYIIEPRDEFYLDTNPIDVDAIHDTTKGFKVIPMGALDAKRYVLTNTPDADYYNTFYQNKRKRVYGDQITVIDNDFIRNEKVIQTGFSSTPAVAFQTDIIAPRYLTIEGAFPGGLYTVKPTKVNPRILWYGGVKNCAMHNLTVSASSITTPTTYPYVGHLDDPQNPTYDLNFAAPKDIYYLKPAQVLTTNTRGNDGYYDFLNAISNPNSKIVQVPVIVNEMQVYGFTFRQKAFFKGAYFYVNKLSGYDPTGRTAMLELLKVPTPKAYIGVVYNPTDPPTGTERTIPTNPEYSHDGNYLAGTGANIGRNLNNGAGTGLVVGTDVVVDRAVQEFSAIGVSGLNAGLELDGKVMLRNNGLIVSDTGIDVNKLSREVYSADFDVTKPINYVDCSAGNVKATLPSIDYLGTIKIVRVDNSGNVLTVVGNLGTELIKTNGASAVSYAQPTQSSREYNSDLTSWYY
jgi:hypothetical protein